VCQSKPSNDQDECFGGCISIILGDDFVIDIVEESNGSVIPFELDDDCELVEEDEEDDCDVVDNNGVVSVGSGKFCIEECNLGSSSLISSLSYN
jgi:hypothetical protein